MAERRPLVIIGGQLRELPTEDTLPDTDGEWTAETVSQVEAEAGTATTRRAWTAERVKQAISAWWSAAKGSLTGPVAISADSSSPALKVTQTGAGNCLEINDAESDSTPAIVTSDGKWQLGHTALIPMSIPGYTTDYQPMLALAGAGGPGSYLGIANFRAAVSSYAAATVSLNRSKSDTIGAHAATATGDIVGALNFAASDGIGFVNCAEITGYVEGAVSSGVVPGGLRCKTADLSGAMLATFEMAFGNVAIGGAVSGSIGLCNRRQITGNTTAYGQYNIGQIQSGVTTAAYGTRTYLSTAAAAFTLPSLSLNSVGFGTLGAGSSISAIYGHVAENALENANAPVTQGFRSAISSGSGRHNFYASGTAPNYYAGVSTFAGGAVSTSPSVALGYGTGAGGTVTQSTGKSYSVTLNKPTGTITTASSELTVGELAAFKVNNSIVKATDTVTVSTRQSVDEYASIKYRVFATGVAAGAFTVIIENIYGTSLSEAVEINFTVTPGATS